MAAAAIEKSKMAAAAILKNRKIAIYSRPEFNHFDQIGMVKHFEPLDRPDR